MRKGESKMKKQEIEIKVGQTVTAIFAWREDEHPTADNFFTGKVTSIIERSKYAIYVRIQGLEQLMPIDRVSMV